MTIIRYAINAIATASLTVNAATMALCYLTGDRAIFMIGLAGAGLSGTAWLYLREETK